MRLVSPEKIAKIDEYAVKKLGISARELMGRGAEAIADAVRDYIPANSRVLILAGGGNNGGDGYAAATLLLEDYRINVIDVFGAGQRSGEGKYYLERCRELGCPISVYDNSKETRELFNSADLIIDAVLGAGARLPLKSPLDEICRLIKESRGFKIAVDIPLGTDAFSGEVCEDAPQFNMTVSLCLPKTGVVTYPAKENAGRLVSCDIGLSGEWVEDIATDEYTLTDSNAAKELLPEREENSSKGSFGRLSVITGSAEYMGAALLSVGGALRSGVGYLCYFGERESLGIMLSKYPEVIFKNRLRFDKMTDGDIELLVGEAEKSSAILIGCGCGRSSGLRALIYALLKKNGAPLIIDADGINVLSEDRENALKAIKDSPRVVILTPHPLEFARLIGKDVSEVQAKRLPLARDFAKATGAILVLKGAATVTADGGRCFINSSGSSALAKAGSGDVLAGVISSLIASSKKDCVELCALGVYAHGRAGDILSGSYSTLGVIPSELPEAVGVALAELQQNK